MYCNFLHCGAELLVRYKKKYGQIQRLLAEVTNYFSHTKESLLPCLCDFTTLFLPEHGGIRWSKNLFSGIEDNVVVIKTDNLTIYGFSMLAPAPRALVRYSLVISAFFLGRYNLLFLCLCTYFLYL